MTRKVVVAAIFILIVSAAGWWWMDKQKQTDTPVYKTAKVTRGDVRSKVTATGTLQAVTQVLVGSQISGNIERIFVKHNSEVKAGEVLAQLEPSTYRSKVEQAQASVSSAVANLGNAQGDLGNASANVKSADAAIIGARAKVQQAQAGVLTARSSVASAEARIEKAKANLANGKLTRDRNQDLRSRDLIAQSEFDAAQTAYQGLEADLLSAQADLESARASLTAAQTVVASAESDEQATLIKKQASLDLLSGAQARIEGFRAQVAQAEANLESARIDLQRTTITSPIDGLVMNIAVTEGQTVAAQFQAPDLFTLAKNLDQMQVETSVDEADVGRVKVGARATFTVDAFPEEKFQGQVTEVRQAPVVTTNVVTYTVIVSADNPKLLLKPGMTATVEIYDQEKSDVLLVPAEAFRFRPERASGRASSQEPPQSGGVYLLENHRPVPREAKEGVSDGMLSEVIGSELKEGQEVVLRRETRSESTSGNSSGRPGSRSGPSTRGMRMF